jgi:excisionase family DNA binding protein
MEKLLSHEQTAEILGISGQSLNRIAKRGELDRIRVGSIWRYKPSDINAYLERSREAAKVPA